MYIYKVVKGEEAAVDLLRRMGVLAENEPLHWCESFAHVNSAKTGEILVERLSAKSPTDDIPTLYVILYMKISNPKAGQRCSGHEATLREWAYEDIRTGKVA